MLDHSTMYSKCLMYPFQISVVAKAIRVDPRGELTMEALRFKVKIENEVSSLFLNECKKHGKGNERIYGFVHDGKKVKRTLENCLTKKEN